MFNKPLVILSLISAGIALTALAAGNQQQIAYPENYRDWRHVKSMVILPGHSLADPFEGIHHIYANDKALRGYASGAFPDGAVIVFDLLKTQEGGNALQEGDRKLIGVMARDGAAFVKTGGWGFEAFAGDSKTERLVKDSGQSCYACHTAQEKSQYVYSKPGP